MEKLEILDKIKDTEISELNKKVDQLWINSDAYEELVTFVESLQNIRNYDDYRLYHVIAKSSPFKRCRYEDFSGVYSVKNKIIELYNKYIEKPK